MITTFYLVQKEGLPAVWQVAPERLLKSLKRKQDFKLASDTPSGSRREALNKLRQLFPGHRPVKLRSAATE